MKDKYTNAVVLPYLFRATKYNKVVHILGTDHGQKLDIFPSEIRNLLLSSDKLLMERLNFTIPEMVKDFVKMDKAIYKRSSEEVSLFSDLPPYEQRFIKEEVLSALQVELNKIGEDISDLKDEFIFGLMMGICTQTDGVNSMDVQLRDEYRKVGKPIVGLEESIDLLGQVYSFYQDIYVCAPISYGS